MDEILGLTEGAVNFGFGILIAFTCLFGVWKIIMRVMDENKEREKTTNVILTEVSNTNKELSNTNNELAETNRLIVDKLTYDVQEIGSEVHNIKESIDNLLFLLPEVFITLLFSISSRLTLSSFFGFSFSNSCTLFVLLLLFLLLLL